MEQAHHVPKHRREGQEAEGAEQRQTQHEGRGGKRERLTAVLLQHPTVS